MPVNCKKEVRIKNTTKYFDPSKDKTHVCFPSSSSFYVNKLKVESFETRLYWQFRYCQSLGCPTYFYTLTYNDKSVPEKYGTSCFDYFDLRDFLTGGFRKQLLRKFGVVFKYFIGAELGEGKGKRGIENNPHYHILFFLEPAPNCPFPLNLPSAVEFRHLVRLYWQGFDEDEDKKKGVFHYYEDAKYGIAKEGDYLGLVKDYRACSYCAKYVTKDVRLKMKEVNILKLLKFRYFQKLKEDLQFHKDFFHEVVKPLFFFSQIEDKDAFVRLLPSLASFFSSIPGLNSRDFFASDECFVKEVKLVCSNHGLWSKYYIYLHQRKDELCRLELNEWRNRHSNKPRISQGVGLYALDFIEDLSNPKIMVPSKKGNLYRQLPLYFYRKLFTGEVKPNETFHNGKVYKASSVRVLNSLGLDYKCELLESRIIQVSERIKARFSVVDESLFNMMVNSDVNTDVRYTWEHFVLRKDEYKDLLENGFLFRQYAIYKLVYQDRYFEFDSVSCSFPELNYLEDYRRFLVPSVFSVPRSDLRLDAFLEDEDKNYMSYEQHPDFLRFVGFFALFDLINDYLFIQKDNVLQTEYKERDKVRAFHVKNHVKQLYSTNK